MSVFNSDDVSVLHDRIDTLIKENRALIMQMREDLRSIKLNIPVNSSTIQKEVQNEIRSN